MLTNYCFASGTGNRVPNEEVTAEGGRRGESPGGVVSLLPASPSQLHLANTAAPLHQPAGSRSRLFLLRGLALRTRPRLLQRLRHRGPVLPPDSHRQRRLCQVRTACDSANTHNAGYLDPPDTNAADF